MPDLFFNSAAAGCGCTVALLALHTIVELVVQSLLGSTRQSLLGKRVAGPLQIGYSSLKPAFGDA
jgi:hypothetical protein